VTHGTLLEIDELVDDTGAVVGLSGELDLTNAHRLDEALARTTSPVVILDLGALAFVDSAGIRVIDQAHQKLGDEGRRLLIVADAQTRAAWTFRVAGFSDGLLIASLDEARERAAAHLGAEPLGA
jgi:anti-sigma B factor antagonist